MLQNFAQTRFNAFLIHLAFSALVAFTIILAAILIWYPDYFLDLTGAKKIFLMIIGIDVCIGPILTFIVFNKAKKGLGRDLSIIFLIQLSALAYGMYTITIARPVYIVFAVDRFELVQANEITKKNLNAASEKKFRSMPLFSPKWVGAILPTDKKEKEDLLFGSIDAGVDLAQLPKYYKDYSASIDAIKNRAVSLTQLVKFNNDKERETSDLIKRFPDEKKYGYLPLSGKKASLTVIIDKGTGQPIEISRLNPW